MPRIYWFYMMSTLGTHTSKGFAVEVKIKNEYIVVAFFGITLLILLVN